MAKSLEDQYLDEFLETQAEEREYWVNLDDEDDVLDQFRDYWMGN